MKYVFLGVFTAFILTLLSNIYLIRTDNIKPRKFEYFVLLPNIDKNSIISVSSYEENKVYAKLDNTEMKYLIR